MDIVAFRFGLLVQTQHQGNTEEKGHSLIVKRKYKERGHSVIAEKKYGKGKVKPSSQKLLMEILMPGLRHIEGPKNGGKTTHYPSIQCS